MSFHKMKNETIINKQNDVNVMKRLIISLIIITTFLFPLISAVEIDTVKQGDDALLYQTCNNCTYCNFTKISGPDNKTIMSNVETTKDGTHYSYNLDGGNTTTLGTYTYCYYCGNSEDSETGCIDFEVTPSGRDGNSNIALVIILIVMIYAVTFISFYGRNIPLSVLTGMMMTFFGVWIVRNGIVVYRDNLTNYFGYATIFIGALIALWAAIEWGMEEIF